MTDGGKEHESQPLLPSSRDRGIYLDNGKYEKFTTLSCKVCNGLFSIVEDGFKTSKITEHYNWFGRHSVTKRELQSLRISGGSRNNFYPGKTFKQC